MIKLSETRLFKRYRGILQRNFKTPSGVVLDYDVYETPDSVHVLALTSDKNVVLVREFRPGPEKFLTELPAGMLAAGEDPLAGAQRELIEETGYRGNACYVNKLFRNPYSIETLHVIVCTNCIKVADPTPDENEFLETIVLSLPEFKKHLASGNLTNGIVGYMGLEFLKLL